MKQNFTVGKKIIGQSKPVFIIAEAGVNHNGKLDLAIKLIDAAGKAGADAVKFQTFCAEQVVTGAGKMANYQKRNMGAEKKQIEMLRELELPEAFYPKLMAHAKKRGILFFSTPHGHIESAQFLTRLNMPLFKVGSGDLTNLPLLKYLGKTKKPIIFSIGMATMPEVGEAIATVRKTKNEKFVVLHATTDYPCKAEEVNLRAMVTVAKKFNCLVGYSDHTTDSQAAIMAVAMGAVVLERHLTLDKNMSGPDHKASSDPKEFAEYVRQVRQAELILGSAEKKPSKSERQYIGMVRRSIVASRDIEAGEKLTLSNLTMKRPGTGIPPKHLDDIIGKKAKRDITKDTLLRWDDIA